MHEITESVVEEILDNGESFISANDAEYAERLRELKRRIGELGRQKFKVIADAPSQAFPSDLVERLGDRWTRTLQETLAPALLIKPPSNHDWDAFLAKKMPEKGLSPDAADLLSEMKEAYLGDKPFTPPDKWPTKTKGFFDTLMKLFDNRRKEREKRDGLFQPAALEWTFAHTDNPLRVPCDGFDFRLAGTIDRVDVGPPGLTPSHIRLLDYKTSKSKNVSTSQDVESGKALQLAAYAVAYDQLRQEGRLPEGISVDAELKRLSLFALRSGKENAVVMDNLVEHCRSLVAAAAKAIRAGKLAPAPKKGCPINGVGFCDFTDLCRARQIPRSWLNAGYENNPTEADNSTTDENGEES